jgi:membrane-associated protease RseP (regulator of RpoE activity)
MTTPAMTEQAAEPTAPEPVETDDRRGYLRLAAAAALLVALSFTFHVGGKMLVVGSIMAMIMLHEFGHFITARWAGMRVTDFYLGFGPSLWSVQRGETRYGVRALPLGGYVRVIGMNNLDPIDDPADEPYTYRSKTWWQKVRFASAGTFMHFLIAFILMIVLLAGFGRYKGEEATTTVSDIAPTLSASAKGPASPAKKAGLQVGDRLVAIDGKPVKAWENIGPMLQASGGKQVLLTIQRDGASMTLPITPEVAEADDGTPAYRIGIAPKTKEITDKMSVPSAVWNAGFEIKNLTIESGKALAGIFTPSSLSKYTKQLGERGSADPQKDGNRLLSPYGVWKVAGASAAAGGSAVLTLLISINIFVGIFNMVPLPPFDGGHVAVATYEAIASKVKRRKYSVDMAKLLPVAYAVIMALVLLSASALWLDIMHPFNLG